jgi:hypothetical protein
MDDLDSLVAAEPPPVDPKLRLLPASPLSVERVDHRWLDPPLTYPLEEGALLRAPAMSSLPPRPLVRGETLRLGDSFLDGDDSFRDGSAVRVTPLDDEPPVDSLRAELPRSEPLRVDHDSLLRPEVLLSPEGEDPRSASLEDPRPLPLVDP